MWHSFKSKIKTPSLTLMGDMADSFLKFMCFAEVIILVCKIKRLGFVFLFLMYWPCYSLKSVWKIWTHRVKLHKMPQWFTDTRQRSPPYFHATNSSVSSVT